MWPHRDGRDPYLSDHLRYRTVKGTRSITPAPGVKTVRFYISTKHGLKVFRPCAFQTVCTGQGALQQWIPVTTIHGS